ncbi:MAG: energy-coupling factor ABC transporter ATP-binding protein [Bacteroidota bacterium]
MSHHLLEVQDLAYAYADGTAALSGVSFRLTHGEAVGIVGANGAGKSTLLLILAGVLLPTAGKVRVGDVPLTGKTLKLIRRHVGLVFQDPDDQLFMPTVGEDVAFGPRNLGLPPEEVEGRVAAALEAVGAGGLRGRPPYRLSGGEKKAAAIAAVLAMQPDVLVLDEPSAGLDPRARRRLGGLLAGFTHTKVLATHDLDLVMDLCPRTIVLREGRVLADGPTAEIMRDGELLDAGGLEKPLRLQTSPPGPLSEAERGSAR